MSPGRNMREVTVTRVEWVLPSGAEIDDFRVVQEWAWQDCARRNGWDVDGSRDDNWCHVEARDEEVVFAFTVEKSANSDRLAELDRLREFEANHARCIAERDSEREHVAGLRDALGRVEALLKGMDGIDTQLVTEWPRLVRDAIEGKS